MFAIAAIALVLSRAAIAQTPANGNSGAAIASSNSGSQASSPYPAWALQAGPIASIPFDKTSAGINFDASQYQGSVVTPATGGVLDLSLDDAIRRGLEYNLALRVRKQQQQISRGLQAQAKQALLPVITASGSTALTEINLVTEGFRAAAFAGLLPPGVTIPQVVSFQSTTGQMNLSWSMFNYSNWKQFRAAKIEQEVSAGNTQDSRETVVLNVAQAYLQVLAAFTQLNDAKVLLQADELLVHDTILEHEAGVVANIDELRARVQLQAQQQTVIADEGNFAKRNIALERMIGLDPAQKINLTSIVPFAELDNEPALPQLREAAWATRPDYRGAQQQVQAAKLQRDAARAERLPTLSFGGYYGVIGITYGSYYGNFAAQANLDFPIFEEAKFRGDRAVAEEQLSVSRTQVENLKEQIDADLRDALLDYDAAKSLVGVARSNVDLTNLELDQARERYKAGVTENLPVVDAEADVAAADTNYVNGLYQFNVAKLELARALGIIDAQYRQYLSGK